MSILRRMRRSSSGVKLSVRGIVWPSRTRRATSPLSVSTSRVILASLVLDTERAMFAIRKSRDRVERRSMVDKGLSRGGNESDCSWGKKRRNICIYDAQAVNRPLEGASLSLHYLTRPFSFIFDEVGPGSNEEWCLAALGSMLMIIQRHPIRRLSIAGENSPLASIWSKSRPEWAWPRRHFRAGSRPIRRHSVSPELRLLTFT